MNIHIDLSQYKHFSFDLWMTLIRSHPDFKRERNKAFHDYFQIEVSVEEVAKELRYYDVLCNKISEHTGRHLFAEQIYYMVLSRLGVDISEVQLEKIQSFYQLTKELFRQYRPQLIYSDIHQLFDKIIAQGKTISVLSNTAFINGGELRELLNYYGLSSYFSFQLYSDEVGWSKPSVVFFQALIDSVNELKSVPEKKIVHIGDNPFADVEGAKRVGISSILVEL